MLPTTAQPFYLPVQHIEDDIYVESAHSPFSGACSAAPGVTLKLSVTLPSSHKMSPTRWIHGYIYERPPSRRVILSGDHLICGERGPRLRQPCDSSRRYPSREVRSDDGWERIISTSRIIANPDGDPQTKRSKSPASKRCAQLPRSSLLDTHATAAVVQMQITAG